MLTTVTQKSRLSCSDRARPIAIIEKGKVTPIEPLIDGGLPKAPVGSVINDGKHRENAIVDQRPQLPIPADEESQGPNGGKSFLSRPKGLSETRCRSSF